MTHPCRVAVGGRLVPATWRREGDELLVVPEGAPPRAVELRRVTAVSGDGFRVVLGEGEHPLVLERLGADGPALLAELGRDWPPLRARALRLADTDRPRIYRGAFSEGDGPPVTFSGFFAGDLLLRAPEGGDLEPFLLHRLAQVRFDPDGHAVVAERWDGASVAFSRLAGDTNPFHEALAAARADLAARAAATLARQLPTLGAGSRAALALRWLPGAFLSVAALEELAPGFGAAFDASWLATSPRAGEGRHLLGGTAPADALLGYLAAEDPAGPPRLALLARRGGSWLWETISEEDFATYRFRGDDAVPAAAEGMLALPQFSREALHLPLAELAGERSELAIAARDLAFLRTLRAAFAGRVLHGAPERWRTEVGG